MMPTVYTCPFSGHKHELTDSQSFPHHVHVPTQHVPITQLADAVRAYGYVVYLDDHDDECSECAKEGATDTEFGLLCQTCLDDTYRDIAEDQAFEASRDRDYLAS